MNKQKVLLYCKISLLLFFTFQTISPVYATANTENAANAINISFKDIEDIIEDHNIDLKIAYNNLKQSKDTYDDLCDEIDDLEKSQKENKDKINKLSDTEKTIQDEDVLKETKNTIKSLKDLSAEISNKINELENKKENLKYSIKVQKDQYDILIKNLVFKAQNQYIEYLTLSNKEAYLKDKVSYEKNQASIYKYKLDCGFISQKNFDEYCVSNTQLSNQLNEVTDSKNFANKTLKNTLGISQDENINISADISSDLENISAINLWQDTKEMLNNSLNIHIKEIQLDCVEDLSDDDEIYDDYDVDNAELSLEQEKNNAILNFEKQYNLLMASYNSIKTNYSALLINKNNLKVMNDTSNYGFNSRNKINKAQLDLVEQNNNLNTEINTLYINYSKYIQMKMGY